MKCYWASHKKYQSSIILLLFGALAPSSVSIEHYVLDNESFDILKLKKKNMTPANDYQVVLQAITILKEDLPAKIECV